MADHRGQALPQPRDMHIDAADIGIPGMAGPGGLDQSFAAEHGARARHQTAQQIEFNRRRCDVFTPIQDTVGTSLQQEIAMHEIAGLAFDRSICSSGFGLQPVKKLFGGEGSGKDLVRTGFDEVEMQAAGAGRDEAGDRRCPRLRIALQNRTEFRDGTVARLAVHDHGKWNSVTPLQQLIPGHKQLAVEAGDTENMAEHQEKIRVLGIDQDTWPHERINLQRWRLQADYSANRRIDN